MTLSESALDSVVRDTLAGFPVVAVTRDRHEYTTSATDRHLNGEGTRVYMTELARVLVPHLGGG